MPQTYCVFLRGINVNRIKIKMDELKDTFCKIGFGDVKTILATGNVIATDTQNVSRQDLKLFIEKELGARFDYDAHVLIRNRNEIRDIVSAAKKISVPDGYHNYYLLCEDNDLPKELEHVFCFMAHRPDEQFHPFGDGAFWIVPKGATLDSEFGSKVLGDKKYKSRLTSRNLNTLEKINECMGK
ncbi:MAG: DUF1697 domain-containing protein [Clostridiales bacterium]|nr:DUF1697 domain-containing protein [Clostridiales bacterium]